jgi:pSer/pThr/pTyr-binding forkhead associated (FHA) protein
MSTQHLLIVEDDAGRRKVSLLEEIYSVGRDPKCDIRLYSFFISRRHATLVRRQREDGSYYYQVIDGDAMKGRPSSCGILINGRKVPSHDLENGDKIFFTPEVHMKYYQLTEQ